MELTLSPSAEAALPKPPERAGRTPAAFAGFISYSAPPDAGFYQVTLSSAAWLDVIQGAAYLKPAAFSGAPDCAGVRKLVRFELQSAPFVLQISDAAEGRIKLMVERK